MNKVARELVTIARELVGGSSMEDVTELEKRLGRLKGVRFVELRSAKSSGRTLWGQIDMFFEVKTWAYVKQRFQVPAQFEVDPRVMTRQIEKVLSDTGFEALRLRDADWKSSNRNKVYGDQAYLEKEEQITPVKSYRQDYYLLSAEREMS